MDGIASSRIRKKAAKRRQRRAAPEQVARILLGQDEDGGTEVDMSPPPVNKGIASPQGDVAEAKLGTEDPSSPPSGTGSVDGAHDGKRAPDVDASTPPSNVDVIVLLEGANLETTKARTGGQVLLNSEEHANLLRKTGRTANDARPDITHQCLLALMDSPLNKAGRLKVYVRTKRNVLIAVHKDMRVPRTARRFYGLMAELLAKLKVRGTSGSEPLLRVIRNPITSHLPVGTRRVVCTYNTDNVVDVRNHAKTVSETTTAAVGGDTPTVLYVVGAIAHGKVEADWAEENICISEYPLSAATVCSRITYAYECLLGIL